jgi:hypothetical protein
MEKILVMKEYKDTLEKIKVTEVEQTCFGCPSSWNGKTADGKEIYARYRWGYLRVMVDEEVVFGQQLRDDPPAPVEEYQQMHDNGMNLDTVLGMMESDETLREFCKLAGENEFSYHGIIDYETLKNATKDLIEWPEESK